MWACPPGWDCIITPLLSAMQGIYHLFCEHILLKPHSKQQVSVESAASHPSACLHVNSLLLSTVLNTRKQRLQKPGGFAPSNTAKKGRRMKNPACLTPKCKMLLEPLSSHPRSEAGQTSTKWCASHCSKSERLSIKMILI